MNGPHLKVRWVVAHWKHIDRDTHRERARERQTHTLQTAYICTHINHSPPSSLLPCVCVRASISKVIQARKNFGNWKFAHKNLSPFSSCALAPPLPHSFSLSCLSVCGTFHYAIYQATSIFAPPSSSPRRKKNCYLEHYRDARKLVEVLELFTLISLDVLFFISGHIL